jgi:ubiquinone/menaquinone biosynthesis C-methylase UbiE
MMNIYQYIARQFGHPAGFGGNISTCIMNRLNQKQYKTVIENLHIQPVDSVLDIGFGNGYLLGKLLDKRPQKIYGIDISADMLNNTAKKYETAVAQGKMQLLLADVQQLPFENLSIDKACTINTVYFWQNIHKGLSEVKRILKPDGLFLNAMYVKEWFDRLPVTQYGFSKFTVEQIEKATAESGFKVEQIIEIQSKKSICIIARKEERC